MQFIFYLSKAGLIEASFIFYFYLLSLIFFVLTPFWLICIAYGNVWRMHYITPLVVINACWNSPSSIRQGCSAHTQAVLDKIKVLKLNIEVPISVTYFPIQSLDTEIEIKNGRKNEEKVEEIVSVIETINLKDINANMSAEGDLNKLILDTTKEFELVYKSLQKWDDLNSDKNWLLLTGNFKLKEKVCMYMYVGIHVYIQFNMN